MKRQGNLYAALISEENLLGAIWDVNKTHHWRTHHRPNRCTAWVEETIPQRVQELREIIENGFVQKPPKVTERYDASAQKWRTVSEPAQWPDQYVHHALIRVMKPAMMRDMDPYCCGSIEGRGIHYGKQAMERWMRKDRKGTKYCLTMDIRHFYDSLTPEVVLDRMRKIIKDRRVLGLVERTMEGGILIGAYTSQWYANTTLQPLDHMIRQGGYGVSHYLRYIDNFTVFGPNKRKLRRLKVDVEAWLNERGMQLKGDWQIFRTDVRPPQALGFRYGRGYTIPRKRNLLRIKRAVAKFRRRRKSGRSITPGVAAGLLSRIGQLRHCRNVGIYRRIFHGERIIRALRAIIRTNRREELTWNMYLAQRARSRCSAPRAPSTAT